MEPTNKTPASTPPAAAGAGCAAPLISPERLALYAWHIDPGHEWLSVPVADVSAVRFYPSPCSYIDRAAGLAYLEEDCDAPGFLRAAGLLGRPELRDVREIDHGDSEAPCRRLPSLSAADVADVSARIQAAAENVAAVSGLSAADLSAAAGAPLPPWTATLDARTLRDALQGAALAMSEDENRFILCGLFFEYLPGAISITGCDGRRLHVIQLPADVTRGASDLPAEPKDKSDNRPGFIMPALAVSNLISPKGALSAANVKRMGKTGPGRVSLSLAPDGQRWKLDELNRVGTPAASWTGCPTEGNFPRWRAVIPKHDGRADVATLSLTAARNLAEAEDQAARSFPDYACALPPYADHLEHVRKTKGDADADAIAKRWKTAAKRHLNEHGRTVIYAQHVCTRTTLAGRFPTYATEADKPNVWKGPFATLTHYDDSLTAPDSPQLIVNAGFMRDGLAAADYFRAAGAELLSFTTSTPEECHVTKRPIYMGALSGLSAAKLDGRHASAAALVVIMPQRYDARDARR